MRHPLLVRGLVLGGLLVRRLMLRGPLVRGRLMLLGRRPPLLGGRPVLGRRLSAALCGRPVLTGSLRSLALGGRPALVGPLRSLTLRGRPALTGSLRSLALRGRPALVGSLRSLALRRGPVLTGSLPALGGSPLGAVPLVRRRGLLVMRLRRPPVLGGLLVPATVRAGMPALLVGRLLLRRRRPCVLLRRPRVLLPLLGLVAVLRRGLVGLVLRWAVAVRRRLLLARRRVPARSPDPGQVRPAGHAQQITGLERLVADGTGGTAHGRQDTSPERTPACSSIDAR
ncbi:hypothetical protein [Thermomonospora echinospora]|uniref:hypothetical protein n=1 Tax=Thermomonospora echinospora TaxID=1992 RepID=UPI0013593E39|nr:hypothetical protein [Thermomonospora echinospora]